MTQTQSQWIILVLVAVTAVLATIVVMQSVGGADRFVMAQLSESSAGYIAAVAGVEKSNRMPLVLVDTKKMSILVYDYDQFNRRLYLRAARTFLHDRELEDEQFEKFSTTSGPSVQEVKDLVKRQTTGR